MKILNFIDFAALPAGTIFSYYEPVVCQGLLRKGNTILSEGQPIDYFETSLIPLSWDEEPPSIEAVETRWAEYEYRQQYVVFERPDLDILRSLLPPVPPLIATEEQRRQAYEPKWINPLNDANDDDPTSFKTGGIGQYIPPSDRT